MSLRVLGRISSINVRKVLWTCAELDLPFEHVENDANLLAQNPNRLVPVIRDDDFVLWESNSICRYLARKSAHGALYPEGARERARVEQWMDWQATELNSAWRYSFYGIVRKSAAHQDPAQIAKSLDAWNGCMRLLDAHFTAGGQFITGEFFTLADVLVGLSTHRWLMSPIERPHLDALHGYYQRLSVRPAFRAHVHPDVP
jgi:glutathione S-transferase